MLQTSKKKKAQKIWYMKISHMYNICIRNVIIERLHKNYNKKS